MTELELLKNEFAYLTEIQMATIMRLEETKHPKWILERNKMLLSKMLVACQSFHIRGAHGSRLNKKLDGEPKP